MLVEENIKSIAIIGAGFAGLSAAAYLAKDLTFSFTSIS